MYTFFVLGIIPGTNITISFVGWLQLCLLAVAAIAARKLYRTHRQRITEVTMLLANTIGR